MRGATSRVLRIFAKASGGISVLTLPYPVSARNSARKGSAGFPFFPSIAWPLLIITEKPNAAKKIAEALADGKPIKESHNKVPYYKITHGKRDLVIGCAVGHELGDVRGAYEDRKEVSAEGRLQRPLLYNTVFPKYYL